MTIISASSAGSTGWTMGLVNLSMMTSGGVGALEDAMICISVVQEWDISYFKDIKELL
jgi:hypothetical protein